MSWISKHVRPRIESLLNRRETPENLWRKCTSCDQMIFHRELTEALYVCPNCDNHMNITPRERFAALYDNGVFEEIKTPEPLADPLSFKDKKRYTDRMKEARKATGEREVMMVVKGQIGGVTAVSAGQNFDFLAGSMGMGVGNALISAARESVKARAPLIVFSAAGGARMQEGILSLMQMPRSTVAVEMVRDAGLPYIVVLTHPTTGGVTASYAMLGDVQIAEPNALICFAGPRVIEQTIRETLPEGFQRSEYLLDHGMLDRVVHRARMRDELTRILRMLMNMPPLIAGRLPTPEKAEEAAKARSAPKPSAEAEEQV